jgi:hydroxymethylpyrimidine/phosphomethylpyrimidine kinase
MATVLTIAGSDSGGGAGIQADLRTLAALGVHGASAIAALTAQNTRRVAGVHLVPAAFVTAQIDAVAADIPIQAVKTGMLGSAEIVSAVAAALQRLSLPNLVVDPVLAATSGAELLDDDGVLALRRDLLPLAAVVTPNRREAEVLSGRDVHTRQQARDAARALADSGARAVVVTGGHFDDADVVDLVYDGSSFHEIRHERLHSRTTHGTGCTLSAAIAAGLARNESLLASVVAAVEYVAGAIAHGYRPGSGDGTLDHFWRCQDVR